MKTLYFSFLSTLFLASCAIASQSAENAASSVTQAAPVQEVKTSETHKASGIEVVRFVLATDVASKEPQGIKESFSMHDAKVFAFASFKTAHDTSVTFEWKHEGKKYYSQKLSVKASPHFRTFAHVKALVGSWSVSVMDEHGAVLKELNYSVSAKEKTAEPSKVSDEKTGLKDALTSLEPKK